MEHFDWRKKCFVGILVILLIFSQMSLRNLTVGAGDCPAWSFFFKGDGSLNALIVIGDSGTTIENWGSIYIASGIGSAASKEIDPFYDFLIEEDTEIETWQLYSFNLIIIGRPTTNILIKRLVDMGITPDDGSPSDWMLWSPGDHKLYTNPFGYGKDVMVISGADEIQVNNAAFHFWEYCLDPYYSCGTYKPHIIVVGENGNNEELKSAARVALLLTNDSDPSNGICIDPWDIKFDVGVTTTDLQNYNLIPIGNPATNLFIRLLVDSGYSSVDWMNSYGEVEYLDNPWAPSSPYEDYRHIIIIGGKNEDAILNATESWYAEYRNGYVILVLGRDMSNTDKDSFVKTTKHAFNSFRDRYFSKDSIYFISPYDIDADEDGINDVDSTLTEENIRWSIETWAARRVINNVPLYIIPINHGYFDLIGIFSPDGNSNNDELGSTELNTWLNNLMEKTNDENFIVILGACHSGSYINDLSEINRIIITSSKENEYTWSHPQVGQFFTTWFFDKIGEGKTVSQSFNEAANNILLYIVLLKLQGPQTPLLDDNGDDVGHPRILPNGGDGFNSDRVIGGYSDCLFCWIEGDSVPVIDSVSSDMTINGPSQQFWADVTDDHGVESVFAYIFPPSYTQPEGSYDINVPTITMTLGEGGRYYGTYSGFIESGNYNVVINAIDNAGNVADPKLINITVQGGSAAYSYVFPHIHDDGTNSNARITLSNATGTTASVTLTFNGNNGNLLGTSPQTIPPHGKLQFSPKAILGANIVGSLKVNSNQKLATAMRQVKADNSWAGMTTAENVATAPTNVIYAHVHDDGTNSVTFIGIRNVGTSSASLTMKFYDNNGTLLSTQYAPVGVNAKYMFYPSVLLGYGFSGSIEINSTQKIASYVAQRNTSSTWLGMMNAVNKNAAPTTIVYPHVHDDGTNSVSFIGIRNLGTSPAAVSIYFYNDSGIQIFVKNQTIAANAKYMFYPRNIVGGSFVGSVDIYSTQPIAGYMGQRKADSSWLGMMPGTSKNNAPTHIIFSDIQDSTSPSIYVETYIGIKNVGNNMAAISIYFYDNNGNLLSTKDANIGINAKYGFYPKTLLGYGFEGTIEITSTQPIAVYGGQRNPTSTWMDMLIATII